MGGRVLVPVRSSCPRQASCDARLTPHVLGSASVRRREGCGGGGARVPLTGSVSCSTNGSRRGQVHRPVVRAQHRRPGPQVGAERAPALPAGWHGCPGCSALPQSLLLKEIRGLVLFSGPSGGSSEVTVQVVSRIGISVSSEAECLHPDAATGSGLCSLCVASSPVPWCLVAWEVGSGRGVTTLRRAACGRLGPPPLLPPIPLP